MSKRTLSLRRPLIALAASLGTAIISMVLFGFPGVCGPVGGVIPTAFPSWEFLDIVGALGTFGGLFAIVVSAVWLVAAGIVRLLPSDKKAAEQ